MDSELNYDDLLCPDLLIEDPILTNLFPIEVARPPPPIPELKLITDRLESLEIAMNTQSLRIEIERTKRQKLRASLDQIKSNLVYPSPGIDSLQQAFEFNYAQQNTTNFQLGGEIDKRILCLLDVSPVSTNYCIACSLTMIYPLPNIMRSVGCCMS